MDCGHELIPQTHVHGQPVGRAIVVLDIEAERLEHEVAVRGVAVERRQQYVAVGLMEAIDGGNNLSGVDDSLHELAEIFEGYAAVQAFGNHVRFLELVHQEVRT